MRRGYFRGGYRGYPHDRRYSPSVSESRLRNELLRDIERYNREFEEDWSMKLIY